MLSRHSYRVAEGRNSALVLDDFVGRRMRSLVVYSRDLCEAQSVKAIIIP